MAMTREQAHKSLIKMLATDLDASFDDEGGVFYDARLIEVDGLPARVRVTVTEVGETDGHSFNLEVLL